MALELVGGALLAAFLQVAFEKLASPQVLNFFRGTKLDQKLLSNLEIKLQSIQALADDAELKQFRDKRVRNWLLRVKDVVLDAEDLLDEIQHELSKDEDEAESESQTCTCKVLNFFKSSPVSSFNKDTKSRMEQVLDDLEFLSSQQSALGLKNASSGVGVGSGFGGELSQKLPSTSFVVESDIYGRDDDKELIFNWFTSDTDNGNKLSILSIVGMGGIGKTTLVQHVYNDPRIEGKFDCRAWVCVSDDFDVFKVTRTVLERITGSTDDSRDLEMVQGRLKEKLSGEKFLLVLDDVWNRKQKEWKDLQAPLVDGAQGSKIVVTTRDLKVATIVGSSKIHTLSQLQGDHSWNLFAKYAFQDDNHRQYPNYKEIGLKLVEKCKGLPLALTTIGSLLHQKPSISEWESILQSERWEFYEEDSNIIPALALSYHNLPSQLKRCFAYCALFPNDYLFEKESLIQFWMAQKFLQCPQQSKSPEGVGEHFFNELLSRSFFQQTNFGPETYFVMHDLLNDLARYVCGEVCFRLEADLVENLPNTTRHFSVAIDHGGCFDGFGKLYDARRLRTFMPTSGRMKFDSNRWHCKVLIRELFSKCKFLRLVSLFNCSNLTEIPDSVGNLKNLCSLDLSYTDIEKLPESSCSLYNLQILKLNSCRRLKESKFSFMNEWEKWESEAVTSAFPSLQQLSIYECPKLKGNLPEKLVNLKILLIWNCEQLVASVPMAPGNQELHQEDCGKLQFDHHPTTLKRIGHMISVNSLEQLSVDYCPNMNIPMSGCHSFLVQLRINDGCDSLRTFLLDCFPALQSLTLRRCRNLQTISQNDSQNHLKNLSIIDCPKLESLPKHMHILLPILYELAISDCPKVESFPERGLPSNLKRMSLQNVSKLIASFKRINSSINRLVIGGMDDVECLPEEGLLPISLTSLRMVGCQSLTKLDYKGLSHLSFLKELYLENCPSLQSLPEEGLPKSISTLTFIGNCPLLNLRCQKPDGQDWPKIAHIQDLCIC